MTSLTRLSLANRLIVGLAALAVVVFGVVRHDLVAPGAAALHRRADRGGDRHLSRARRPRSWPTRWPVPSSRRSAASTGSPRSGRRPPTGWRAWSWNGNSAWTPTRSPVRSGRPSMACPTCRPGGDRGAGHQHRRHPRTGGGRGLRHAGDRAGSAGRRDRDSAADRGGRGPPGAGGRPERHRARGDPAPGRAAQVRHQRGRGHPGDPGAGPGRAGRHQLRQESRAGDRGGDHPDQRQAGRRVADPGPGRAGQARHARRGQGRSRSTRRPSPDPTPGRR